MNASSDAAVPDDIGSHRVLYAGTRKWQVVFLVGVAFAIMGVYMGAMDNRIMGWAVAGFFALVALIAGLQLLGVGSKLELNADTFELTNFGRRTTQRWDDTTDFAVFRTGHNELVGYDRARDIGTHMGEMNRAISGRTACLPDTFGLRATDLASLMNAYQAGAVERAWQHHAEAVTEYKAMITANYGATDTSVDVIIDRAQMKLPEDMAPWPSVLVVHKDPHPDGSRHVLITADILSPASKWVPAMTKQVDAFKILRADELQIINAETMEVHRIMPEGNA